MTKNQIVNRNVVSIRLHGDDFKLFSRLSKARGLNNGEFLKALAYQELRRFDHSNPIQTLSKLVSRLEHEA